MEPDENTMITPLRLEDVDKKIEITKKVSQNLKILNGKKWKELPL